ncbi:MULTISPECIES: hypothetical protein [Lysobacter]|uniref:hypothetical protein n=1 Tax=Lysobacter TaxID=68 RepID=UPI001F2B1ED5|nr:MULTISPECIES: hypothetical protein [Lysobacter]UJB18921.1 hypothetical protein L1A79_21830 [Lysobacter capsici]UJQ27354.1 hypothetical protein L2D09_18055 [Lysobacter gummosus]
MRIVALFASVLGALVFGGALIYSFVRPIAIESLARDLIRVEVQQRVGETLRSLDDTALSPIAARMSERARARAAQIRRQLDENLPRRVAEIATQMRDPDCACRARIETGTTTVLQAQRERLLDMDTRLTRAIGDRYMQVADALIREFRIFSGANALVFVLLGAVTLARPRAGVHLLLPLLVLVGAAGLTAYFYLFQQDWLRTIVFGDYVGFAYLAYLGLAALGLSDIAFNRARLTTAAINGAGEAIGMSLHVMAC